MKKPDSKQRFSDRVADYSRYRPGYPPEVASWIFNRFPLDVNSAIADIGAGTGLFTELLLEEEASVIAVEPNESMRAEADFRLSGIANYRSMAGSAESTGLGDSCVDLITAAQAFHWFDHTNAKIEFERILKPEGAIVLLWNRRDSAASEFLAQYEGLLKSKIPEYDLVSHANATDAVIEGFLGADMTVTEFQNYQYFDLQGLKGRLLSSSYCPASAEEGHDELMSELEKLYELHATDNGVRFDYCTQVYTVSDRFRV